jgi:hypothetical protein
MPTPDEIALIDAASRTVATGANIYAQGRINKKTREWNEAQYAKQRADSLADWNSQNNYNSPQAQMARLREAGLNPNLVYGKGADNTAAPVRSSQTGNWSPSAPDIQAPQLGNYYDYRLKQAQIDNLAEQNTLTVQQQALTMANTAKVSTETARSEFDLNMASDLRETSLEMAKGQVRKQDADIDYTLSNNERATALTKNTISQSAEAILLSRSQRANNEVERQRVRTSIEGMKTDNRLKLLDEHFQKMGIQKSDPLYMRAVGRVLQGDFSIPKWPTWNQVKTGAKNAWKKVTQ